MKKCPNIGCNIMFFGWTWYDKHALICGASRQINLALIPPMENQWKAHNNQQVAMPFHLHASVLSTQHRKLSEIQDSAEVSVINDDTTGNTAMSHMFQDKHAMALLVYPPILLQKMKKRIMREAPTTYVVLTIVSTLRPHHSIKSKAKEN